MPKRLIDLDDDLLMEAQRELGTTGVSDTVRAALRQAAAAAARAGHVEWLASADPNGDEREPPGPGPTGDEPGRTTVDETV